MSKVKTFIPSLKLRGFVDVIVDRVTAERELEYDPIDCAMDIMACHLNGCPLDLEKLSKAKDCDLFHDVCGIRRHLNRQTGRLMDCFLPRCAAKKNGGVR